MPAADARAGAARIEREIRHAVDAIAAQDARLFDAYNGCDLATLGAMVSEDLEFYHDQTGLTVGREPFVKAIRENICHKTHRLLVPGSLEVYPLKTYGAVEVGEHVFCPADQMERCNPKTSGIAKLTMLWQQKFTGWVLTRVISYDHVSDWRVSS